MDKAAVTLLICTRNRCASLAATLASVSRAVSAAEGIAVEVILVDNGSTDATPGLIAQWRAEQPFRVISVEEPRPGLARARNRGLVHRAGDIVAMTDDDCILHPDYVPNLVAAFAKAPGPAIIGGRILLGNPADLPVTVKLEDHPMVAPPGMFPGGFVMGANLAFGADVLAAVGPFDERFGAGAPFVAAEDTDFLLRASRLGIALLYDPLIVVDHHHGRREIRDETRVLAGYAFGDGALYAKHLFNDKRVRRMVLTDVCDLRLDVLRPVTTHAGVRRFYLFRLFHKARGFLSYWRRGSAETGSPVSQP
ncbi:glycosyltransferase family 2 protein [Sphingomonas sp. PAMC 26621]|uniref:glycosyltransferase family 2 protein n=1 Tax=Sphingomonas sp. PAMC 26621 TaxID=1112213 RepID=UPI000289B878|nr:glycosyltransferase family 2 protein [Sphingomonas sp. PAMC 26621]